MLTDGCYERLREGKVRQPFFVEVEGGQPFAMAWLWAKGKPEDENKTVGFCIIITTEAKQHCSETPDRMPVILDADDYDAWDSPGSLAHVSPAASNARSRSPADSMVGGSLQAISLDLRMESLFQLTTFPATTNLPIRWM